MIITKYAFAITIVLVCASAAYSQADTKWRLVPGIDSMVIGPLDDMRHFAALRVAKNQQARHCVYELLAVRSQARTLRTQVETLNRALSIQKEENLLMADRLMSIADENRKLVAKSKRRNPFTWMAIGAIGVIIVNNVIK